MPGLGLQLQLEVSRSTIRMAVNLGTGGGTWGPRNGGCLQNASRPRSYDDFIDPLGSPCILVQDTP